MEKTTITTEPFIPTYDVSEWRAGFEVELLFGDLGLNRYRRVAAEEGGYDTVPVHFCKAIAKKLSRNTGADWVGTDETHGKGFFVVPEPDLDPLSFSNGTVGGLELITPPLPIKVAEELRGEIIRSITEMENGYYEH